jgi:hypothetical protein
MPAAIVTETCPAPKCNLSGQDIEHFIDEMRRYPQEDQDREQNEQVVEQGRGWALFCRGIGPSILTFSYENGVIHYRLRRDPTFHKNPVQLQNDLSH